VIKSQLALNVAGQLLHFRLRVVEKAVDAVLDEIVAALARNDRAELRGFGAFSVKVRSGRIARNPKSGVKVRIAEKRLPVFRPSKEIGRRLNSGSQTPKQFQKPQSH